MTKLICVSAALLVVSFLTVAPTMAASIHGTKIGPAREALGQSLAPEMGFQEITLSDGVNFCCLIDNPPCSDPPDDPDFNVGDTLTIDSYWQETVPDSPDWVVEFTAALKVSGRPLMVQFNHEPVAFGPVDAGTFTFCLSYDFGPLPNKAAGRQNVKTGFGVQSDGGELPPSLYNTFDVNP
jgi:hypothetical protein